jgi:hypothetical protein
MWRAGNNQTFKTRPEGRGEFAATSGRDRAALTLSTALNDGTVAKISRGGNGMKTHRCLAGAALAAILPLTLAAQKKLSSAEAKDHIRETATVCGSVVSTHYGPADVSQPRQAVPESNLHGADLGREPEQVGTPENEYKGKRICVTGKITEYRGAAEIVANNPQQIRAD